MKCVPSHTHRGLWSSSHFVSTSLMSRRRSNIDFMRRSKVRNVKTRKNIKITCFAQMSQNARFWGGPKITQNWPFWGGSKNDHFWGPKSQKPFSGYTMLWWYPPNYLLFRYPVWPPKTLFLGPKNGHPTRPGVSKTGVCDTPVLHTFSHICKTWEFYVLQLHEFIKYKFIKYKILFYKLKIK